MILIDSRSGAERTDKETTVDRLVQHIRNIGVRCEKDRLEYADAAFEAKGPKGSMMVGIERKTLHDMLNCIDDARYAAHQKPGMHLMYGKSVLMLEGHWKAHDPEGWLMESQNGSTWYPCRYRSQRTLYSKLYRYLISVSLSGVTVSYSRDLWHTAYNICEFYHYFQKRWSDHTSLIETQKLNLPDLNAKPSLTRKWAADLTDIGVKYSIEAERLFRTPIRLATADEVQWLTIKGIGPKTAMNIVKEVRGLK